MATQTPNPSELADEVAEYGLDAQAHDSNQRTVVVDRDDSTCSVDGVEALAEREGYFVFSTDAAEITLVAYEDCEWKSR